MKLTEIEKNNILSDFPNIKLSYENIVYKKVLNCDFIVAIPKGKKCFTWFTYVNDLPICLILEEGDNKQIQNIKVIKACYTEELCYGTILYGTLFYSSGNSFFSIEDVFQYKGNNIFRDNWLNKLNIISKILEQDMKQITYSIRDSFVIFGSPIITKTNDELIKKITGLNYTIDTIQFKLFNRTNCFLFMNYEDYIKEKEIVKKPVITKSEYNFKPKSYNKNEYNFKPEYKETIIQSNIEYSVFIVRPDIQDDIYNLYLLNNKNEEQLYGYALIPDFNTSVMMNKIFRIIKENENLDALEESDDEEEFENEKLDKYVHLNKSQKMLCVLNKKFKKWVPIRIANNTENVATTKELNRFNKTYQNVNKR